MKKEVNYIKMDRLNKQSILLKQCINSSQQFSRGSDHCLCIRFPFISLFNIILSEIRATSFDTSSHNESNSSGMFISSFREFPFSIIVARLFNHRVKTAKANKFSPAIKSLNINDFAEKIHSTLFANSWDRCKDFYFSMKIFLCLLFYKLFNYLCLLSKNIECVYFHFKQLFIDRITTGNGSSCQLIYTGHCYIKFPASGIDKFFSCLDKFFFRNTSYTGSRWEVIEQREHSTTKDRKFFYLRNTRQRIVLISVFVLAI